MSIIERFQRRFSIRKSIKSIDFQYKEPKSSASASAKILTDNIETRDLVNPDVEFDFDRYSEGIADIIKGSKPQFSIGIYGDWHLTPEAPAIYI